MTVLPGYFRQFEVFSFSYSGTEFKLLVDSGKHPVQGCGISRRDGNENVFVMLIRCYAVDSLGICLHHFVSIGNHHSGDALPGASHLAIYSRALSGFHPVADALQLNGHASLAKHVGPPLHRNAVHSFLPAIRKGKSHMVGLHLAYPADMLSIISGEEDNVRHKGFLAGEDAEGKGIRTLLHLDFGRDVEAHVEGGFLLPFMPAAGQQSKEGKDDGR